MRAVAAQGAFRLAPRVFVVDEICQREGIEHGNRAGRRLGAVVVLFQPQQHRRVVATRAEPTALLVPETRVETSGQLARELEPSGVPIGLEQLEESPRETGVIFGVAV